MAGEIEKGDVGALLDAFEDQFVSVGRDVEIANVEDGGEIGELALDAGFEVDEENIFVLDFAAEEDEGVRISSLARKHKENSQDPGHKPVGVEQKLERSVTVSVKEWGF